MESVWSRLVDAFQEKVASNVKKPGVRKYSVSRFLCLIE